MAAHPTPDAPMPVEAYLDRVLSRIEPMPPYEHTLMDALGLPVAGGMGM